MKQMAAIHIPDDRISEFTDLNGKFGFNGM